MQCPWIWLWMKALMHTTVLRLTLLPLIYWSLAVKYREPASLIFDNQKGAHTMNGYTISFKLTQILYIVAGLSSIAVHLIQCVERKRCLFASIVQAQEFSHCTSPCLHACLTHFQKWFSFTVWTMKLGSI